MAEKYIGLGMSVEVINEYNQARLVAEPVSLREDDEKDGLLYRISGSGYGEGWQSAWEALEGFKVTAYVGFSPDSLSANDEDQRGRVWGESLSVERRFSNAAQIKASAAMFTRLEKGLQRIEQRDGYRRADDYAGLVLRVCRVLKITEIRVHNTNRRREMTGQRWGAVDGVGLQYYVTNASEAAQKGNLRETFLR
jgi:hypothetical protein